MHYHINASNGLQSTAFTHFVSSIRIKIEKRDTLHSHVMLDRVICWRVIPILGFLSNQYKLSILFPSNIWNCCTESHRNVIICQIRRHISSNYLQISSHDVISICIIIGLKSQSLVDTHYGQTPIPPSCHGIVNVKESKAISPSLKTRKQPE